MPAIRSHHWPSSLSCSPPERPTERLALSRLLSKFATQPIDIARARSHHKAFERRKPHRTVHALAAIDCAHARSVAKMHADELQIPARDSNFPCSTQRHIFVGGSVEAEAPEPCFPPGLRNGIGRRARRIGQVEGRVENRHLRQFRPYFSREPDCKQVRRVVKGREGRKALDVLDSGGVEHRSLPEALTAMNDPMANGIEMRQRVLFHKSGDRFDRGSDVLVGRLPGSTNPACFNLECAAAVTERLEGRFQEMPRLVIDVEHAKLQAGAAAIQNEYPQEPSAGTR